MDTNFTTWLTTEMDKRGWNNSELARRAGLLPPLPAPDGDPLLAELLTTAKALPPEERKRLARVAKLYLAEHREKYEAKNE